MKKKPTRSFKRNITLSMILSSTLPILVLGFFSLYFINITTTRSVEQRLDESLKSVDKILTESLTVQMRALDEFARSEEVRYILKEDGFTETHNKVLRTLMYSYMGSQNSYLDMYLISVNGDFYGTSELPKSYELPLYANWGIFREAQNSDQVLFYPNNLRTANKSSNAASLIRALYYDNELYGYMIVDLSTEYLQNIIQTVKGTSFGYIQFIIASSNGEIIYNDSQFNNSVMFLENVFRYDRFTPEFLEDNTGQIEHMMMKNISNNTFELTYYGLIPDNMLVDQGRTLTWIVVFMVVFVGGIAMLMGIYISQQISRPIVELARIMETYNNDQSYEKAYIHRNDEIGEIYLQFVSLMKRVDDYHYEGIKKQELLRQSEIKALMSQINPHFLYNTLDSIKWKAKLNETEDIAVMVTELGNLLKGSMDNRNTLVSIYDEIQFVESYIQIQKFRYGDRFEYVSSIQDNIYHYIIPKLILQPLVENALVHGIETVKGKGIIELSAWEEGSYLYFSIADNGVGTDLILEEILNNTTKSIGLRNVDQRIKLYYGHEFGIRWESEVGRGTVVFIKIPKIVKEEPNVSNINR
ncbi:MAG: sensor histidine kinase [Erysipelothrix sp.]